jgi:hypothetical protein
MLRLHLLSVRNDLNAEPVVSTTGNRIEGMRLGKVAVKVDFDDEPLTATGSDTQLADFYRKQSDAYRQANAARFNTAPGAKELARLGEHHKFTIVRQIQLIGDEPDKQGITVSGNEIHWKGFGRIFLGEVHVKNHERKITLVRLAMGSDAGGSGSAGSAGSNGDPVVG